MRAGLRRLRPVLMTSLAAAPGMLPLAWGVGNGAPIAGPAPEPRGTPGMSPAGP